MKKTYIIPNTMVTLLNTQEQLLEASAHLAGQISDVTYGGVSTGDMSSDVKSNSYSVWDDDWSQSE